MNLDDAIAQGNVLQVESIIKQKLDKTPCDVELWIKLCLTELQFPLEDYVSALKCIAKIYALNGILVQRILQHAASGICIIQAI